MKILIETVQNGFIVTEDYKPFDLNAYHEHQHHHRHEAFVVGVEIQPTRYVFNTHEQLSQYLTERVKPDDQVEGIPQTSTTQENEQ